MAVSVKRERQRRIKVFRQEVPRVKWFGRFLSLGAILLSLWSNKIFQNDPHEWFDITGRVDILLLGFALLFSLTNVYIKAIVCFIDAYIGKVGKVKMMMNIGGMLLPFFFLINSLVTKHELYIMPLLIVILIHFYNHYKTKTSTVR